MAKNKELKWTCLFCGNDEMYFDRSISYFPDGTEEGMTDRCTRCGKSVDELPNEGC